MLLNAKIAIELGVDGHRADLTLMKASQTLAALEGREQVGREDVLRVAEMVFLHRMKSLPFERAQGVDMERVQAILYEEGTE